ncbi:hypothetical protein [Nostoc parmelioides]|nr:hypothetical protein [Nostoc parmelioides]
MTTDFQRETRTSSTFLNYELRWRSFPTGYYELPITNYGNS